MCVVCIDIMCMCTYILYILVGMVCTSPQTWRSGEAGGDMFNTSRILFTIL